MLSKPSLLSLARLTAASLLLAAGLPAGTLSAEPISVTVDRAKVMRVSRPADVVIIGNPAIADATIQDNQTLIITGRSYGTTNLIVLDAAGNSIADETVTVQPANDDVVTIYKRASRETYSCKPDCAPVITIGDNNDLFSIVKEQVTAHGALSSDASNR